MMIEEMERRKKMIERRPILVKQMGSVEMPKKILKEKDRQIYVVN